MNNTSTIQIQFNFEAEFLNEAIPVKKSSEKQTEKFVFEMMDILTSPNITYTISWADAIPDHLKQDIKLARLIDGFKKEEQATIPETVAYMITRTFEAPMSHEWANIYLWCSAEYLKQYRNKTDEDFKEIQPREKLSEYEQGLLKRLRIWIYEKRREHIKNRLK